MRRPIIKPSKPPKPPKLLGKVGSVDPDDADLFRATVGDIAPLPDTQRISTLPPGAPPFPRARKSLHTSAEDGLSDHLPEDAHTDEKQFARSGVSNQRLRKLQRGHWPITATLDLHGLNRDQARLQLVDFLQRCKAREVQCARIIHGRGLSSANGEPVLKQMTRHWLRQHADVLGFVEARPEEGGAGAVVVLLRRGA